MKLFLQILLIFLTWFSNLVNATPAFSKVALPIYTISFPKAANQNQESEVKIGAMKYFDELLQSPTKFNPHCS